MKIKKIVSNLISLFVIFIFTSISNYSYAEYYLVYSGNQYSCERCYKSYSYKIHKITKRKHHTVKHHQVKTCGISHHSSSHPKKYWHSQAERWIPAYWVNGYWVMPHKTKYVAKRTNKSDYDLDLTTGDDNPYVDPEMDIDY